MTRRIVLHVGTEKTGTTAIQGALWSLRHQLADHGFVYPQSLGPGPHIAVTACALDFDPGSSVFRALRLTTPGMHRNHIAQTERALRDDLAAAADGELILSDEHINVHLNTPGRMRQLAEFLSRFGTVDQVIIYFRRQDRLLEGITSECVKNGLTFLPNHGFAASQPGQGEHLFNYESIISCLEAGFPDARLILRPYPAHSDAGFDAVSDFLTVLGNDLPAPRRLRERPNSSIPGRVIAALSELSGHIAMLECASLAEAWPIIIAAAAEACPDAPYRLPRSDALRFLDCYAPMNKRLISRHPQLAPAFDVSPATFGAKELVAGNIELGKLVSLVRPRLTGRARAELDNLAKHVAQAARHPLASGQSRQAPPPPANENRIAQAQCPVCGCRYALNLETEGREARLCPQCGASGRISALVHLACEIIHGDCTPLDEQPVRKDFMILGLSDSPVFAGRFAEKYSYTNTFFHKEPVLDITRPGVGHLGRYDLLISSEVFEHVTGPSPTAFAGAFSVLKPGGHLLLTVPFVNVGEDREHYQGVIGYTARRMAEGGWVAELEFEDGSFRTDHSAIFHGGPGLTLEMRLFNRKRLLEELAGAGFVDIVVHDENMPQFGINWGPASRPVTARKPPEA